jgi:hypothetical protein
MTISYVGLKDGKYQLKESVRGVLLQFEGTDKDKFAQVEVPENPTETRVLGLTVECLAAEGLIPWFDPEMTQEQFAQRLRSLTLGEMTGRFNFNTTDNDKRLARNAREAIEEVFAVLAKTGSQITPTHLNMALFKMISDSVREMAHTTWTEVEKRRQPPPSSTWPQPERPGWPLEALSAALSGPSRPPVQSTPDPVPSPTPPTQADDESDTKE